VSNNNDLNRIRRDPPKCENCGESHSKARFFPELACEHIKSIEKEVEQLTAARTLLQETLGFGGDAASVVDGIKLLINLNEIGRDNVKEYVGRWTEKILKELNALRTGMKLPELGGKAETFEEVITAQRSNVSAADSPYVVHEHDTLICTDSTDGPITVVLPVMPHGKQLTIKDAAGTAGTNPVTLTSKLDIAGDNILSQDSMQLSGTFNSVAYTWYFTPTDEVSRI